MNLTITFYIKTRVYSTLVLQKRTRYVPNVWFLWDNIIKLKQD